MNVLVISTIAGRVDRVAAVLERARAADVEAIFVLGNLTDSTHACSYEEILALLVGSGLPLYITPGAHDGGFPEIRAATSSAAGSAPIRLVHRSAAPIGSADVVAGFGGQIGAVTNGYTIAAPVWEARVAFEHLASYDDLFKRADRRFFLFGAPPQAQWIDRDDGLHIGIPLLNTLIRTYRPHLVCCAGSTDGHGIERVENTLVVNPGALADGSYAIVDLDRLEARIHWLPQPITIGEGQFRSILVALDGSAESWRGLEIAAGLARTSQARLTLVHAWEPVSPGIGEPYLQERISTRVTHGELLLETASAYIADLSPACELIEGTPVQTILRAADVAQADLIIMGARGLGSVQAMLGSVSSRVLRQAPCPVLITRQTPHTPALADWNSAHVAV